MDFSGQLGRGLTILFCGLLLTQSPFAPQFSHESALTDKKEQEAVSSEADAREETSKEEQQPTPQAERSNGKEILSSEDTIKKKLAGSESTGESSAAPEQPRISSSKPTSAPPIKCPPGLRLHHTLPEAGAVCVTEECPDAIAIIPPLVSSSMCVAPDEKCPDTSCVPPPPPPHKCLPLMRFPDDGQNDSCRFDPCWPQPGQAEPLRPIICLH